MDIKTVRYISSLYSVEGESEIFQRTILTLQNQIKKRKSLQVTSKTVKNVHKMMN